MLLEGYHNFWDFTHGWSTKDILMYVVACFPLILNKYTCIQRSIEFCTNLFWLIKRGKKKDWSFWYWITLLIAILAYIYTSFCDVNNYSVCVCSLKFSPFFAIRFHSSELPMSFSSNVTSSVLILRSWVHHHMLE